MYYLINECFYLIAVIYLLHRVMKLKFTKNYIAIGLIILSLPAIYFFQNIQIAVLVIETLVVVLTFLGEKLKVVLLSCLGAFCIFAIVKLLVRIVGELVNLDTLIISVLSAALVILLAIVLDKTSFIKKMKDNKSAQIFATNALINLLLITIIFVIIYINFDTIPPLGMVILLVLVALFMVTSQIVTFQFIQNTNKLNQNNLLFEIQKHTYENSLVKYKERIAFLHDVKAYLASLNRMLNDNNTEDALKLIKEITGDLNKNKMVYSHNQYINLIINEFETEFKNNMINFNYSEVILSEINVESMDIISLFYNIISNALEAAKKSEDKIININVKLEENILYVDGVNSVPNGFEIDKVKMGETSKKQDKDLHGIGLLNLNKIIKKYSGNMEFFEENGMFKIEVFILN